MAWQKLGRPAAGQVTMHPKGSYTFEQGAEVIKRLEGAFGDLSRLTCLDLGCGPSETVVASQVLQIPWRRLISVEAFMPYVYKLRQKTAAAKRHDIHEIHIEDIFEEMVAGEAQVALLIDVLEHFPQRDALRLLARLEKFVSRGVVIFSPVGHVEQEDLDGNALQRHRSFWQPEDWARLGYDVNVYEAFHGMLNPPATAAWAIKTWNR
jgi:2-polyprenyl-3-methyl-5-hydroxy-6-metoxy-1,4-benzoquinol methylase